MVALKERLMSKGVAGPNNCIVWTGYTAPNGYGTISLVGKKRTAYVHRVSHELHNGPIPEGLTVDHLCMNRACINPNHLEAVTARENVLRSPNTKASINRAKTHCPQGHPYEGYNLVMQGRRRTCRECSNAKMRRRRNRIPPPVPVADPEDG